MLKTYSTGLLVVCLAAENSPEHVKYIVETFTSSSTGDLKDVSKGGLLTLTGFLSFMITGCIYGIRFGVILGGTLLAFGIYRVRSWKKGESSFVALKGQTDTAGRPPPLLQTAGKSFRPAIVDRSGSSVVRRCYPPLDLPPPSQRPTAHHHRLIPRPATYVIQIG